jgi:hypothetical protein
MYEQVKDCPIILLWHSLGGLIVKRVSFGANHLTSRKKFPFISLVVYLVKEAHVKDMPQPM